MILRWNGCRISKHFKVCSFLYPRRVRRSETCLPTNFTAALATHSGSRDDEGEPTYMNSLMNSMALVLDEFYKHLKVGDCDDDDVLLKS